MKRQLIRTVAMLALATGAILGAVAASAHEGATGIVKERMELMKDLAASVKSVSAMLRGKEPYDAGKVRRAAHIMAEQGGKHLTRLFPDGSLDPPTAAKPAIWKQWRRFLDYADELRGAARALEAAADRRNGGQAGEAPKAAFKRLTDTCKSCHKDFRKPEH